MTGAGPDRARNKRLKPGEAARERPAKRTVIRAGESPGARATNSTMPTNVGIITLINLYGANQAGNCQYAIDRGSVMRCSDKPHDFVYRYDGNEIDDGILVFVEWLRKYINKHTFQFQFLENDRSLCFLSVEHTYFTVCTCSPNVRTIVSLYSHYYYF